MQTCFPAGGSSEVDAVSVSGSLSAQAGAPEPSRLAGTDKSFTLSVHIAGVLECHRSYFAGVVHGGTGSKSPQEITLGFNFILFNIYLLIDRLIWEAERGSPSMVHAPDALSRWD